MYYPRSVDKELTKEILSIPEASHVHKYTAISKKEAIAAWIIQSLPPFRNLYEEYAFVGNIGIKAYIKPSYKLYVDASYDIDVAVKNVDAFKVDSMLIKRDRLIRNRRGKFTSFDYKYYCEFSPFEFYRFLIPPFKVGNGEYKEVDIFDIETGIGPIPLESRDFKKASKVGFLYVLPLDVLLATYLNTEAYTDERLRRAFWATISNENVDVHSFEQRIEESVDRVRKAELSLIDYKNGFGEIRKKCEELEKMYERKKINGKLKEDDHLENWKNIRRSIERLYERLPVD